MHTQPGFSRAGTFSLKLLAALAAVAAAHHAREVLIPLALSVLFAFLLTPLVTRLERWGFRRVFAVLTVFAVSTVIIGILATGVSLQFIDLARELPNYQQNLRTKIRSFKPSSGGALERAISTIQSLDDEISKPSDNSNAVSNAPLALPVISDSPSKKIEVVREQSHGREVLSTLLASVMGPIATTGIVVVFIIFMLIEREDLRNRFIRLVCRGNLNATTLALEEANQRVSRYLLMQLVVNACYGLPIGIGLYVIGVPNAALWGLLATLLRFIPYAGPVVAALVPITLAFAVDPGWMKPVLTIILFVVLELVTNNLLEPWLYGSSTGISPVAIMVAAAFWTWLWGPIGLLLSTPLTVCLVVLGRYVPHLEFLSIALSDTEVLPLPSRFYQRLLALDQEESMRIAEKFRTEHSWTKLYSEVVLPALVLAEEDRHKGVLDETKERFILDHVRELIDDFGDRAERTENVGSPTQNTPVLCIPARDEADELAAIMLAQILRHHGVPARPLSISDTNSGLEVSGLGDVSVLCISAVPPAALIHARSMCKRLQKRHPHAQIVTGIWEGQKTEESVKGRLSAVTCDIVVTSLAEAVEKLLALSNPRISDPMVQAPIPSNETERLKQLRSLNLLDTKPEEKFDRVTKEAATMFDVPISLISLIDAERQFWKSQVGLPEDLAAARESPRATSLCGHVAAENSLLVVEDILKDKRFANNPVLRRQGIRFYAGAPLRTATGFPVGSLCILDTKARSFSKRDGSLLSLMADRLMKEVET